MCECKLHLCIRIRVCMSDDDVCCVYICASFCYDFVDGDALWHSASICAKRSAEIFMDSSWVGLQCP